MAMHTNAALRIARSEPRPNRAAVGIGRAAPSNRLERSRTRRPCFRRIDRLVRTLFSRSWPQWRNSLIMVRPATVLRWRREWSAPWRYRARVRRRGGRPRVSGEVRQLIAQMARQNSPWGAQRIRGELPMLGFTVSQATPSGYLPARTRRPAVRRWPNTSA